MTLLVQFWCVAVGGVIHHCHPCSRDLRVAGATETISALNTKIPLIFFQRREADSTCQGGIASANVCIYEFG